jgi:hypothetical protein
MYGVRPAGPDRVVSVSVWMRQLNEQSWTWDCAPFAPRRTATTDTPWT